MVAMAYGEILRCNIGGLGVLWNVSVAEYAYFIINTCYYNIYRSYDNCFVGV